MSNVFKKISPTVWVIILFFILSFSASGFLYWDKVNDLKETDVKLDRIRARIVELEDNISSTTNKLTGDITNTHNSLSNALNDEKRNVGSIQQQLGEYKKQVGDVSTSVTTLQKLSKTDPELLAKYSKVFFLNENYAPSRLVEIPNEYVYSDKKILKLGTETWPHLKEMIDAAKKSDLILYTYSAYRSFNEQQTLKGVYSVTYGAGSANTFSADQGYSEHQLGTTIDLIAPGLGGSLDGFGDTKQYQWLLSNAHKYGFIISYPQGNKFYVFEPWHWRFVGVKLATDLYNKKLSFYSMDQRDIDEYLVNLFD